MKKLFALILLFCFTGLNTCFAFSELYYFKNVKTTDIQPVVTSSLNSYGYNIVKENPYYAISQNGDDFAVIILQQSGDNMFYYYQSEKSTRVNRLILRDVKKRDIVCEQSFNSNIMNIYDNLAQELKSSAGAVKKYTFEDEEPVFTTPQQKTETQKPNTYRGYVAQVSAGTKFNAYLQDSINTATASKGDNIVAIVSDNLVYSDGTVIIPQGSMVYGTLSKARSATYGSRNGRVVIDFTTVVTPDNDTYNISAEAIDFTVSNEGKVASTVKDVAAKAAVGAIVGMLAALVTDSNIGRGAAIGAGVGGGASLVYSTAEKGVDAEIPSYTELEIVLTKPFSVSISK